MSSCLAITTLSVLRGTGSFLLQSPPSLEVSPIFTLGFPAHVIDVLVDYCSLMALAFHVHSTWLNLTVPCIVTTKYSILFCILCLGDIFAQPTPRALSY